MPQIYDMEPTALLPLRRKACWGQPLFRRNGFISIQYWSIPSTCPHNQNVFCCISRCWYHHFRGDDTTKYLNFRWPCIVINSY